METEIQTHIPVRPSEAKRLVEACMHTRIVPIIRSSPGLGKSSLVNALAKEYDLELIDLRLAQCDPTDLNGFPMPDPETGRAKYMPLDTFPLAGDPIPAGKQGWLLFLDELTSADRSIQKAAYKLILDRMVGQHKLHESLVIVAAGNNLSDNAIVEEMGTAMESRLMHIHMIAHLGDWLEWAGTANISFEIQSFLQFKPELLHSFDPDAEGTFPCPRTWEFADRNWKYAGGESGDLITQSLAGVVGLGAAREFLAFCRIYKDLPTYQEIVAAPDTTVLPNNPGTLYALTGMIAKQVKGTDLPKVIKYVSRMPLEFQVVTIKDMVRRDRTLGHTKVISDWLAKNATSMF